MMQRCEVVHKEGPLTSLGGDDSDVVPVLPLPVQLHSRGDEAGFWADTKEGLWI